VDLMSYKHLHVLAPLVLVSVTHCTLTRGLSICLIITLIVGADRLRFVFHIVFYELFMLLLLLLQWLP